MSGIGARRGAGRRGSPAPPGRRALAAACCVAVAGVAVGVAASHTARGSGATSSAGRADRPVCARPAATVSRPPEVPSDVLPPQTVLASVQHPAPATTLVTGVVPHDFRSVVEFFVAKLPAAGYRNGAGDAEMDEAEALFTGPGVQGKWKVNGMLGCERAVTLTLYVKG